MPDARKVQLLRDRLDESRAKRFRDNDRSKHTPAEKALAQELSDALTEDAVACPNPSCGKPATALVCRVRQGGVMVDVFTIGCQTCRLFSMGSDLASVSDRWNRGDYKPGSG